MSPFPIPVVAALGPGSQPEDEALQYLPMPNDMAVYHPPSLPEAGLIAGHAGAVAALHALQDTLRRWLAGEAVAPVALNALSDTERALIHQVLGEGEVAVRITGPRGVQAQESVFAGLWRVLHTEGERVVADTLEVGPVPAAVLQAAHQAAPDAAGPGPLPPDTMNAPALLEELRDRAAAWRPGQPSHVLNLTLLPLSAGDSALLETRLGAGRVMILSRGYGNCRIVDTRHPHTWRVTYFNSQDLIILDTLEVGGVPEVACAAREDLQDSAARFAEVLQWVEDGQPA